MRAERGPNHFRPSGMGEGEEPQMVKGVPMPPVLYIFFEDPPLNINGNSVNPIYVVNFLQ